MKELGTKIENLTSEPEPTKLFKNGTDVLSILGDMLINTINNKNISKELKSDFDKFNKLINIKDLDRYDEAQILLFFEKHILLPLKKELKIKPKSKRNKTQKVKLKYNKTHASMISSPLTEVLTTSFKPEKVIKAKKEIHCNSIENSAGILSMIQKDESIDPYDIKISESEILNNYTTIGLLREELQIYLVLVNLYLTNIPKKNQALGKSLEVDVKFLHNEVLGRQDHLREEHLAFYRGIFSRLSTMRLTYKSNKSSKKLFKKREFKNCEIDSNLIQISVTTYDNLKEQTITITPTEYTLLELREIKQFNNFVPVEFFNLDFRKEYDNILFFGICLCNIHRINARSKIKDDEGKTITIKNKTFAWEIDFTKLINKALPHAKYIVEGYENEKNKKKDI